MPSLPSLFVGHDVPYLPPDELQAPRFLDAFDWLGRGPHVLWQDEHGALRLRPPRERDVPRPVKLALAEAAAAAPLRVVAARSLWVFELHKWRDGADRPGPDDPLHLEGALHGPWPSEASAAHWGSLAATRLQVLDQLGRCAPAGWHVFALGGGADVELSRGEAVVLVIPGLEPNDKAEGNERAARRLAAELLSGLKRDLDRDKVKGPWTRAVLPVASRAALEAELERQGYSVKKSRAVKKQGGLLGLFLQHVQSLPPEGTALELARLAHTFLDATPGWPSPRALALRRLVRPGSVRWSKAGAEGLFPAAFDGLGSGPSSRGLSILKESKRAPGRACFRVDEGFLAHGQGRAEVTVEHLDPEGVLWLQTGAASTEVAAPGAPQLGGTRRPARTSFAVDLADLQPSMRGSASFALAYQGGAMLEVSAVTLSLAPSPG